MTDPDLTRRYNYSEFTLETAPPWLRFEHSPPVGRVAPDFPLWTLGGQETSLAAAWGANAYTIVEFGSFT